MFKFMVKRSYFTFILAVCALLSLPLHAQSLEHIKNYRVVSPTLSSAGMPELEDFEAVATNGFTHVISLVPGDYSHEKDQVTMLGMKFAQIEVDWRQPTLADFQQFVMLMDSYLQQTSQSKQPVKVFLHCQLNYRASTFSYLYQITQQGVDQQEAEKKLLSVWKPAAHWQQFIDMVRLHYQ